MFAGRQKVMAGVCRKTQGYDRCLQKDTGLWQVFAVVRHRVMAGVYRKTQGYGRKMQGYGGCLQENARLWWVFSGRHTA